MKMRFAAILAALLLPLAALFGSDAHAKLSPHQRAILEAASPPGAPYAFSFEAPAGPRFSEAEMAAQREAAKGVMPMVMKAFESGAGEVRIPPGDYRFGQERRVGNKTFFPLHFENLRRDAAHPFVIDATGSTFWFELDDQQMPPGHRCVGFFDCSNIVLRGVIIDRAIRGAIEGRITQIDRAGNRFEIQPSPGVIVPATYKGDQRLLPHKSDGRFCAPLYDLQQGVHKLDYQDIRPSEGGRYWVTMKDPDLMERIHDANWGRAFGELGVLRVGDGLSCLYTSAMGIQLDDSANLTIQNVQLYVAKGGLGENGGEGGHLWKDCYFGPRPGTSQWKGADGFLCRATRHGTTMDNVTLRHTADDLQNLHGIWGKVRSAAGEQVTLETNASLRPTLKNARPGDRLRFIHRQTGAFLGEAKVKSLTGFVVTLDRDAAPFAEGQAEWLDHECAGWLVQNCRFEDNFQTFGIMSGPGTLRGCSFVRMGNAVSLNTGIGVVGGLPRDIIIADNVFTDANPRPNRSSIEARAHNGRGQDGVPPIEGLRISGNSFTRSGGPAMNLVGLKDARIEGNRIDAPVGATVIARPDKPAARQAIVIRLSTGVEVKDNALSDQGKHTLPHAGTGSNLLGLESARDITLDGRRLPDTAPNPKGK